MAKVIVVNENDEVIGHKERDELTNNDIYRVSVLWIENLKGEILLAQRAYSKKLSPGMWSVSVGGTIEEGESYEENVIKEAKEELGLNLKLEMITKLFKKFRTNPKNVKYFAQFFYIVIDGNEHFVLQKDEVESVKWVSPEQLKKLIEEFPDKYSSNLLPTLEDIQMLKKS